MSQKNTIIYLSTGFYSPSDAARLVRVSPARIRGWVEGYNGVTTKPIITNQIDRVDDRIALSFVNLIESLFIAQFSRHGIHVRSLRAMADEAKKLFNNPHPFATQHVFRTDGQTVFAEIIETVGDKKLTKLYNLKQHNFAFRDMLIEAFHEQVVYGPEGYAHLWYPRKKRYPNVLINPHVAFGKPVMKDSGIPTVTLYDAYFAEHKDADEVAKWYKTTAESVREAVNFERHLAKAA